MSAELLITGAACFLAGGLIAWFLTAWDAKARAARASRRNAQIAAVREQLQPGCVGLDWDFRADWSGCVSLIRSETGEQERAHFDAEGKVFYWEAPNTANAEPAMIAGEVFGWRWRELTA